MELLQQLDKLMDVSHRNRAASRAKSAQGFTATLPKIVTDPALGFGLSVVMRSPEESSELTTEFVQAWRDRIRAIESDFPGEAVKALTCQLALMESITQELSNLAFALLEDIDRAETLFSLMFRAQESCRKLILAIDTIKNPKKPTQFIKSYVDKQLNQLGGIHAAMEQRTDRTRIAESQAASLDATESPLVEIDGREV
ncbi:hypothetical protein [Leptolyngbya sp. FACHB-17]|uniref:hypothetical protein n=1 Tax=unclassified Leptolyngbya TaxID=2650499 RepID=UPI001681A9A8|nr:hypothetical protein [Leptolyngbya sp. FACHB-17]MBD2079698.1 hypothetical protein [Leptolyngbya sp. FACHB-17]